MTSLPPRHELAYLFDDPLTAVQCLITLEVLPIVEICYECGAETSFIEGKNICKCKRKSCRKSVSIMNGTFFQEARLKVNKILEFGWLWLNNIMSSQITSALGLSRTTTANWIQNYQQLIELDLMATPDEERMIGGPGIIVEIDESKFGKRKYNRGHRVQGVWVVGGVEVTDERKAFFKSTDHRSAERLLDIISRNVRPGSIIHTDCWAGYKSDDLARLGMTHHTVNHEEGFKNPITGVHTNHIEATWRGIKYHFSHKHMTRSLVDGGLFTFVWKRLHRMDLWFSLLNAIKRVDYNDMSVICDDDEM